MSLLKAFLTKTSCCTVPQRTAMHVRISSSCTAVCWVLWGRTGSCATGASSCASASSALCAPATGGFAAGVCRSCRSALRSAAGSAPSPAFSRPRLANCILTLLISEWTSPCCRSSMITHTAEIACAQPPVSVVFVWVICVHCITKRTANGRGQVLHHMTTLARCGCTCVAHACKEAHSVMSSQASTLWKRRQDKQTRPHTSAHGIYRMTMYHHNSQPAAIELMVAQWRHRMCVIR